MVYRPIQSGFSGLLLTLPCSLYSSPTEHTLLKHAQRTHNSGPLLYLSPLTRALFPLTSHDSFSHPTQIFAQKSVSQQASNLFKIILPPLTHSPCPILFFLHQFSSIQSLSRIQLFATPWIAARRASLSITISRSSLRLTSIESMMPSSHLTLCHPLLLLPPIPPSITVFSNESTLHMRWPKYWSFSFSIIPSKEHLGLISFRTSSIALITS